MARTAAECRTIRGTGRGCVGDSNVRQRYSEVLIDHESLLLKRDHTLQMHCSALAMEQQP